MTLLHPYSDLVGGVLVSIRPPARHAYVLLMILVCELPWISSYSSATICHMAYTGGSLVNTVDCLTVISMAQHHLTTFHPMVTDKSYLKFAWNTFNETELFLLLSHNILYFSTLLINWTNIAVDSVWIQKQSRQYRVWVGVMIFTV